MSNELERFVRDNRSAFDGENPSSAVWDQISSSLPGKKEAKRFTLRDIFKWSAAAAVFMLILTSVYFIAIKKYSHEISNSEPDLTRYLPTGENFGNINPEYVTEFKQAGILIEKRQEELKAAVSDQPALYQKFQDDLNTLDSAYRLLRDKAGESINQDVILKAMIQNLQLQSELLARQLMIIKDIKPSKTSKNEKSI